MKAFSWINVTLGVWLMAAALIFSTRTAAVRAEEAVAGVLIAVLSYVSAVSPPSATASAVVACAGVWAIIVNSGALTAPKLNAMVVGSTVAILATVNAFVRHHAATAAHGHAPR
jgi:hypothetical protein